MNLQNIKKLFGDNSCQKLYIKRLSPNDNSKNQVYFGGSFEILNILPISKIKSEEAGDWNRERFKAEVNFCWLSDDGNVFPAPKAQLILYPKYPEVRFSGFLANCENAPSELMTQRLPDRLLFLSVNKRGEILGYVASAESIVAQEFRKLNVLEELGVFSIIDLSENINNRERLLSELYRIHKLNWITSKRLDKERNILPCLSPNCGGYTLEAELGIIPNGYSEPDYLGWEVKQFGVTNFDHLGSAVITLMTPEPTDGLYKSKGAEFFLNNYGYEDKTGREDRINFGGIHKVGICHDHTKLEMKLIGFDTEKGKIRNSNGKIALIDKKGNEAAAWSFSSLLLHWNRKHNQSCYVPSILENNVQRSYKFGDKVMMGVGTDFQFFLNQMANGNIYYDPGIKMENVSTKPKIKKRSQFRIKYQFLKNLYKESDIIDLASK